jgi:hypothetical protein
MPALLPPYLCVNNDEVVFFDENLSRRGLSFGILVAANEITGDPARRTAAHATIAGALAEQRQLITLTVDEIRAFTQGQQVIALIKRKLCELAVACTILLREESVLEEVAFKRT